MNNPLIVLLIGAVVAVGGYFLYASFSAPSEGAPERGAMQDTSGTFASLMASGRNLECMFEHNDGTNVSSGIVYMTGGAARIRGDFNITQSGAGAMEAHMVRDGGYSYVWGSFYPQGIKTKVTAEGEAKLFDKDGAVDEDTTFRCKDWRVDSSKFSLPSTVVFADVSAQVEQIDNVMGGMKAQQCAACNQLPAGSGREQCLQALSCN